MTTVYKIAFMCNTPDCKVRWESSYLLGDDETKARIKAWRDAIGHGWESRDDAHDGHLCPACSAKGVGVRGEISTRINTCLD